MAIKIKIDRKDNEHFGVYPEAYLKVQNVKIDTFRDTVNIEIKIFADEEARKGTKSSSIKKNNIICSIEEFDFLNSKLNKNQTQSDKIIKLAYEHISKHFKDGIKV